jgi:UDP-N-acetylmuramyl pentapeptide synthase
LVRPGGGSALPGLVVSKLAPNLVYKSLKSFRDGLVVITGTAGKSTTTKMVVAIVRAHGVDVFTNPSTANIQQGFFSSIVRHGNLLGKVPGSIAILEMDEGHAARLVSKVKPRTSVILNVFEDQLDRFIDPALVREKLSDVAKATTGTVLLNADDQNCLLIAAGLSNPIQYFGLSDKLSGSSSSSIDYAQTFRPSLPKPEVQSMALSQEGLKLEVEVSNKRASFELPSRGSHFALDAVAALACAQEILGTAFDLELSSNVLNKLPPVFSRGEVRQINGEPCEFILVQNPISMQLNLDNLPSTLGPVIFAIGRDVHDPSWMWTVDYSALKHVNTVSGFNYADAALVLTYKGVSIDVIESEFHEAIDKFFALPAPAEGMKTVIYSADAMRRLRRYMGFTDPEDVERG